MFLIFMSVGSVFGIGGTSVIFRARGEGNMDFAKKARSFCMWACVAVGVAMSALFLTFMDKILVAMGTSADTYGFAKTCLTIVTYSGPFVLIANCYSNVIRAEGQAGKAMMGQLLGYCVGANLWDRFKKIMTFSVVFSLGLSSVMTGICYLFTDQIVSVFLTEQAAIDANGLAWAQPVAALLSTALVVFLYVKNVKKMEANVKNHDVNGKQLKAVPREAFSVPPWDCFVAKLSIGTL